MKRNLSDEEFKEFLRGMKEISSHIEKARAAKRNVIEKLEHFDKNGANITLEQLVQIEILLDKHNYEIEQLEKGE